MLPSAKALKNVFGMMSRMNPTAELFLGFHNVALDPLRIERTDVDVHAGARLQNVDDDQPDHQRQTSEDFKIYERFDADPPDLFEIAHGCDAVHHGDENDRRNEHLDKLDEAVAE